LSKSMSDHDLRWVAVLLVALAGCGGDAPGDAGEAPAAPVPEAGPPLEIQPLGDAELMGVDRGQVVVNLPWSNNVLVREPAQASARATLQSVRFQQGPTFDRFELTFGTEAPFPGYRVVWNDVRTASCAGDPPASLPMPSLLVALEPATAAEGPAAGTQRVDAGLTSFREARRICDRLQRLVWAIPAADSGLVRTVELRDPPRLIVDVQHATPAP